MSNLGQGILEQGIEEGLLKSGMARVLDQECGSRQEDLRLLRKMIAEQNALGARMPEDMDSEQYVWEPAPGVGTGDKESPALRVPPCHRDSWSSIWSTGSCAGRFPFPDSAA